MNLGVLDSRRSSVGGNLIVNTAIGDMADEIQDKTALATLLQIHEDYIQFFCKKWGNVYAYINTTYDLPNNTFYNSKVRFFRDEEGKVLNVGTSTFQKDNDHPNLNALEEVYLPNALSVGNYCFRRSGGIQRIYLPKCLTYSGASNTVFDFVSTGTLYVHASMETINGGLVQGDIAEAQANGVDVRFIYDTSTPRRILDLDSSLVNSIAFKITLTPPVSVNPVEFYTIFIGGFYHSTLTSLDDYICGFLHDSELSVRVKACDSFYNSSTLSNELNFQMPSTSYPLEGIDAYIIAENNKAYELTKNRPITVLGATTVAGKVGETFSFDGVDDYLTSSYFPPVGNSARSFAAWFKTTDSGGQIHIIEYGTNLTYERFTLRLDAGVARFEISGWFKLGTKQIADGNWHLFIYTHDGSPTVAGSKVYIDNLLEIDCSGETASLNTGSLKPLGIGKDVALLAGGRNFPGEILPVGAWNRALTSDERATIWNNGNGTGLSS